MRFTKLQKNIINDIYNRKVYDLASFIENYYSDVKFNIDFEKVVERKKQDSLVLQREIDDVMSELQLYLEKKDIELQSELLSKIKDKLLNYDLIINDFSHLKTNRSTIRSKFIEEDMYLIEDFSLIDDYFYVLKYLESENYIVNEDEPGKYIDYNKYFVYKAEIHDCKKLNLEDAFERFVQHIKRDSNFMHPTLFRYGYYSKDTCYLDYELKVNMEKSRIYAQFFNNTITVKPELGIFIKRNYINSQEYGLKIAHRNTYIAIGVTILVSIASLLLSINMNKSNNEFWHENEITETQNHKEIVKILEDIRDINQKQILFFDNLENVNDKSDIEELKSNIKSLTDNVNEIIEMKKSN